MINTRPENPISSPFLTWAGGKRLIVKHLIPYVPKTYEKYWEPFLGAGALNFALAPSQANLSDSNTDLISCYIQIREDPERVYKHLLEHLRNNSKEYYYALRIQYNDNRFKNTVEQAANFIYLNKTSFNGIFRVNMKGEYNVPYGYKKSPIFPTLSKLRILSNILKGAELASSDFSTAISSEKITPGDFVYLDPPYPPLNGTSYFRHYTASRFSWDDQVLVAELAQNLRDQGCYVMVSNADVEKVRDLYTNWNLYTLPVTRWIAASGKRHKVSELVITSYEIE